MLEKGRNVGGPGRGEELGPGQGTWSLDTAAPGPDPEAGRSIASPLCRGGERGGNAPEGPGLMLRGGSWDEAREVSGPLSHPWGPRWPF